MKAYKVEAQSTWNSAHNYSEIFTDESIAVDKLNRLSCCDEFSWPNMTEIKIEIIK